MGLSKGIIVAGVSSGVGKTTVSLAIMQGLRVRGFAVQPFKVGPDFIDPSYHELACGRPSRNLDPWLMGKRGLVDCYLGNSRDADISVVEGVMGLYDGMSGANDYASTAYTAKLLGLPVILVIDASKSARSVAAVALGFIRLDRRVKIAGLVINNVAGPRHAGFVIEAIRSTVKLPIFGIISRFYSEQKVLTQRHLGLIPVRELRRKHKQRLRLIARAVGDQIDYDAIVKHSSEPSKSLNGPVSDAGGIVNTASKTKVVVALDESFNFYYQDNLEALRKQGAELEFFSPVNDKMIPAGCHGLVLGGGFPEVLADRLQENKAMRESIRKYIQDGMPVYAECGGLMYLSRSISGYDGSRRHLRMVGAVDADTVMKGRLTLGYTSGECIEGMFAGIDLRGHEFHYSAIENVSSDSRLVYKLKKGVGVRDNMDGFSVNEFGIASYTHVHFRGAPKIAVRFVQACKQYSKK